MHQTTNIEAPERFIEQLITNIIAKCPRRKGTSEDERRAHELLANELEEQGLEVHAEAFSSNDSLSANLALHGAVTVLGTLLSAVFPLAGFLCHLTVGLSYVSEFTRRGLSLRRLLKWKPSQNTIATAQAAGAPELRVVFLAHADAALTGPMFDPAFIEFYSKGVLKKMNLLRRLLALTVYSQFVLAALDIAKLFLGPVSAFTIPLEWALTLPSLFALLGNLPVAIKNKIVPGANDNLSGCAALPVLASRLVPKKPSNVELVFVVTGCEECSIGGAHALAKAKKGQWDPKKTVFIGLDGLSGQKLCFIESDGEFKERPIPAWLRTVIEETASKNPRYNEVEAFSVPVGGTDIGPVLARGFDGACLTCFDPKIGAPPDYHLPSDTPEKLDYEKIVFCIDFAEALTHKIIEHKLG